MTRVIDTIKPKKDRVASQEVRRDMKTLGRLFGVLRGKKIKDPIKWQRMIRREWERKPPLLQGIFEISKKFASST